ALDAAFDAMGRAASVTLPPAAPGAPRRRVDYAYGLDGRPASASGIVRSARFDLLGRLIRIVYENRAATEMEYEPNGGPLARVRVLGARGEVLRDLKATREGGQIRHIASAVAGDDAVDLAYDPLKRLTSARYGAADEHTWAFDDLCRLTATSE